MNPALIIEVYDDIQWVITDIVPDIFFFKSKKRVKITASFFIFANIYHKN